MIDLGLGVRLRRVIEDDLPSLFEWRNDPKIWKWCRQNGPLHWMGHLSWFKKQYSDATISMFAIEAYNPKGQTALVGCCGLTDIDMVNRRAEFSLYIEPGYHQNGAGTASLRTLFHHGFKDLGLNRIFGETYDQNPAFNIFTKKLGMTHEGTRIQHYYRDGVWTDCHLVSIGQDTFDAFEADARAHTIVGTESAPYSGQ